MTIAVYIIDRLNRFSPAETAVAKETIAAKLEQHLADRAKYMRKTDAAFAPATMVDAGQTTDPTNPALLPQPPAIVAWDLTLRCPVCNSIVEGNAKSYHCFACERTGRNKAFPWKGER